MEETKQEMKLEGTWEPAFAPKDLWKDQMRVAVHQRPELYRHREDPWVTETKSTGDAPDLTATHLDPDEEASPIAASTHRPEDVRRDQFSPGSIERQKADDTTDFAKPAFEVLSKNEPDFYGQVFGKDSDVDHQRAVDAGAKVGHWGEDYKSAFPGIAKPWKPMTSLLESETDPRASDLMGEDRGGRSDFVAPCPLESVVQPQTCQTFLTGGHPAVPDPVPCPAIQTHCNAPLSLRCNGSCCPVCWAPDHVIAVDRHSVVENADVIPPHPAAPKSCQGVKCFTPLCMAGFEPGHSPGDCCSSCRPAR